MFLDNKQKQEKLSKENGIEVLETEIKIIQELKQETKETERQNEEKHKVEEIERSAKDLGITETSRRKSKLKNKGIPPLMFNESTGMTTHKEGGSISRKK
ncbi:hypothetical protein KM043_015915 [Ampulex compressa]|nr:hypothetical protein KM043_015915 [Ampulex compressa]